MPSHTSAWNPLHWVSELTHVWKDTRLIVLTAQIAAIYAAILIPFKVGIPLIPGFAELRPANAIPIVTSLLFGPAAAWGAGIGNVIGDCFGTLGPASVFGFLGNFFFGYIPHLLWGHMGFLSSGLPPQVKSWRQGVEFTVVCLVASAVCAGTIAWGVQLLGLLPFMILAPAIFFNNIVMGFLLGPPLLLFLYPRVKRWGLRYEDLCGDRAWMSRVSPFEGNPMPQKRTESDPKDPHPILQMENVTFQYRQAEGKALESLSLKIHRGETVVIMGRSGCGKSTLCYTLNGLIPHFLIGRFSGKVSIQGRDTLTQPVWRQAGTVGLVFQDFETQLVSTNVEMELAHTLEQLDAPLTQEQMAQRIQRALEQVGLAGLQRRDPLSLSGGQQQRLVIASLLVREPLLLVLDQPMTDLDPLTRSQLVALFQGLKQQGMTMVLAEPESEDVLHADRIYLLEKGRVKWQGPPPALFRQPDVAKECGIRPLPLTECFRDLGLPKLPITVEEAWKLCDEHSLTLAFSASHTPHETPSPLMGEGWGGGDVNLKPLLHLQQVSFTYPSGVPALSDISLTVNPGEFVAVLGQNGSGKSTLAKLLNGLLSPTSGRVFVAGKDTLTTTMSELARVVGYVFQNPDHQIFAETVWEEVAFGARNIGMAEPEYKQQVRDALTAVGLDSAGGEDLDPFSLTKGGRQRVAVASVLAAKPQVLIFDEPNTGLDAEETDRMMEMICFLNQQGHTIVMITHTMRLVGNFAHRCILMKEGRIIADGLTRDIFSRPSLLASASLELPPLVRFSQRWGCTLLTIEEVRAALEPLTQ